METKEALLAAADIGGTTIKLGIFTLEGELLKKWEIRTDTSENGAHILPDLCQAILKEAGDTPIHGVGIGVPGPVDEDYVVQNCVNLGWGRTDLAELASQYLPDVPVLRFGNDATVAALGELWKGAGRNYDSAYFVTLGTGVGGGYARKDGVISGAHGAAGEIGHITISVRESTACNCGKKGCLEQYASANGMVRLAKNLMNIKAGKADENGLHIERVFDLEIPDGAEELAAIEGFTSKDICDLAKSANAFCRYVIELHGRCLGLAMSQISCAVDPEVFIIGGGLSKAGDILIDSIRKGFAEFAFSAAAKTEIITAELSNDAGIYGCIRMLLVD